MFYNRRWRSGALGADRHLCEYRGGHARLEARRIGWGTRTASRKWTVGLIAKRYCRITRCQGVVVDGASCDEASRACRSRGPGGCCMGLLANVATGRPMPDWFNTATQGAWVWGEITALVLVATVLVVWAERSSTSLDGGGSDLPVVGGSGDGHQVISQVTGGNIAGPASAPGGTVIQAPGATIQLPPAADLHDHHAEQGSAGWEWWLHRVTKKAIEADHLVHHDTPNAPHGQRTHLVHATCNRRNKTRLAASTVI
jgi:hypothetical protein